MKKRLMKKLSIFGAVMMASSLFAMNVFASNTCPMAKEGEEECFISWRYDENQHWCWCYDHGCDTTAREPHEYDASGHCGCGKDLNGKPGSEDLPDSGTSTPGWSDGELEAIDAELLHAACEMAGDLFDVQMLSGNSAARLKLTDGAKEAMEMFAAELGMWPSESVYGTYKIELSLTGGDTYDYTGNPVKPAKVTTEFNQMYGDYGIIDISDVYYVNNTNKGTATAKVDVTLLDGETFTLSKNFVIGGAGNNDQPEDPKPEDPKPEDPKPENPGQDADKEDVISFVDRLYGVCLNRKPDEAGLADWTDRLMSKDIDGISAAYGFIFSSEFRNKNLCNEDYVEQLYLAFMGRSSDAVGKKDWVGKLQTGMTREQVFNGFALSAEFANICKEYNILQGTPIAIPQYGTIPTGNCSVCGKEDGVTGFVKRLYSVCLDRNADQGGLADWAGQLWSHESTGSSVAYGFIFSPEFTNKNYSDADFVEYLYEAFMGRSSDKVGKEDWLGRMKNGWTRKQVFDGFVGSQEFTNICNSYGIVRGE